MEKTSPHYNETIFLLKNSPFFEKVSSDVIDDMLLNFTYITVKRSTKFDCDIGMKYFHIILKGRLKINKTDPDTGKSVSIFLLSDGDGFDIFPLLDDKEHLVSPIAIDDMIVIRAPLKKVQKWIAIHQEFNRAFLPYIGKRLRELESFHESIVFHDTKTRLANLILKHTVDIKDTLSNTYPVKLINDLSHEALAELVSTSRSVLSVQMKYLRDEGIVVSKRGSLAVKNLNKLKNFKKS